MDDPLARSTKETTRVTDYGSTASGGVAIRRRVELDAEFEASSHGVISGEQGLVSFGEGALTEQIAFEAEIAVRAETHEPLDAVDTDLTNSAFGI